MNIIRVILVSIFFVTAVSGVYLVYPTLKASTINESFPTVGVTSEDMEERLEQVRESVRNTRIHKSGVITGEGDYQGFGVASLFTLPDGTNILGLEDFAVTSGPLLYVYIQVGSGQESQRIEIAPLKASQGNQHYKIPEEIDVVSIEQVYIYCKPFRKTFASAQFAAGLTQGE